MARWICNAPLPGSFLQGRGIIKTGQEFETPDDPDNPMFERARESWLPQDAAADALVEKSKEDAKAITEKTAKAAARRRQIEEDAKSGVLSREFETKPDQVAQQFGANPTATVEQDPDAAARNQAWTEEHNKSLTPAERERAEAQAKRKGGVAPVTVPAKQVKAPEEKPAGEQKK